MRRRLTIYYVILAAAVIAVCILVFDKGSTLSPQPVIAGGYDVTLAGGCAEPKFDLRQSGQFVGMQGSDGSTIARLRYEDGVLTGTVDCTNGAQGALRARVKDGVLAGTISGRPLTAALKRDGPDPGAPRPRAPSAIDGQYKLLPRSTCLGGKITLDGGGRRVDLSGKGMVSGDLRYDRAAQGKLTGPVRCADGSTLTLDGQAANRDLNLKLYKGAASATATPVEKATGQKQREFGHTIAAFFLAIAIVMLAARLAGAAIVRIGQPRVMGEVAAGIFLGPTVLGALLPDVQSAIFPPDIIPFIGVAANLGLIFYMFLVGLELDLSQLKGRIAQTAAISNTGVAIPMMAGLIVALPIYELLAPNTGYTAFALFIGVAMSITAFPVLARILAERRMLKRPLGALAIASAAIDDVTAWFLIALATAVAVAGSVGEVLRTMLLAAVFCAFMALVVRRILARMAVAYDEAGRVPIVWITAIFAGVLLSAWATEEIGIAVIFGAFIMGAIMPRHAGLTEDVTRRMEDFVVLLLLPLFFTYTGLKTNMLLIDTWTLLLLTLGLCLVAIVCKFGGTMLAARVTGEGWRESAILGTLMNTRGLTELIVLNLALEKGVISEALFAALVVMALVTTFMTGPILRLLDPERKFSAPVEEELDDALVETERVSAEPIPERSILVAPQTPAGLTNLLLLAEPLARSTPPRELVIAQILAPPRGASARGALQSEEAALAESSAQLRLVRDDLLGRGVAARVAAFTSAESGNDLVRLADREHVDLVMIDARRSLIGPALPRGQVKTVLEKAASDVAVLIAREEESEPLGPGRPLVVPFGGAEHDWAALELGAWLASATGAPLSLLGAAGQSDDRDASRLLANASLLVQRFTGVTAEPHIVETGGPAVLAAASGAGLLIVGLSDRWRDEGLGETRAAIVKAAPAPIVLVRRGTRAGALAPRTDVTRFTWSASGAGPGIQG